MLMSARNLSVLGEVSPEFGDRLNWSILDRVLQDVWSLISGDHPSVWPIASVLCHRSAPIDFLIPSNQSLVSSLS